MRGLGAAFVYLRSSMTQYLFKKPFNSVSKTLNEGVNRQFPQESPLATMTGKTGLQWCLYTRQTWPNRKYKPIWLFWDKIKKGLWTTACLYLTLFLCIQQWLPQQRYNSSHLFIGEMYFQGLTKQIMLKYNLNCSIPIMWLLPLSQKARFSVYVEVKWFSMVSWPRLLFHQSLWDWICQSSLF